MNVYCSGNIPALRERAAANVCPCLNVIAASKQAVAVIKQNGFKTGVGGVGVGG